ncbi:hypothetical protein JHK84_050319 [Glycine max]|nr:hypothetical protein JHK84_050319 [Glycine max]
MGFLVVMFTLRQDHKGSGSDVGLDSDGCLMGFEEGEKATLLHAPSVSKEQALLPLPHSRKSKRRVDHVISDDDCSSSSAASDGIFHSGHTGQVRASGTSAASGTCMHCMAPASARASHRSSAASGSEGLEVVAHVRKLSNESVGSNGSSIRGSDMSNFGIPNSSGYSSHDLPGSAMVSRETTIMGHTKLKSTGDTQLVLPLDQRNKLNRSLSTM